MRLTPPTLLIVIIAYAIIWSGCTADSSRVDMSNAPDTSTAVDQYIRQAMKAKDIPGLSLAVIRDGEIVKQTAYGVARTAPSRPATDSTAYQLASATKMFTGTAIMLLVQDGVLSLDARIGTLLPDLPERWHDVQVHHLLSHTSGLPRMLDPTTGDLIAATSEDALNQALAQDPVSAPGTAWQYNQTGFVLARRIIEHVTGQPWPDVAQQRLFSPLGMQSTTFDSTRIRRQLATSYSIVDGSAPTPFSVSFPSALHTAGGLYSTTHDLARFAIALQSEDLLSNRMRRTMWQPARLADGSEAHYAVGWHLEGMLGRHTAGHTGGMKVAFTHFVDDGLTVILLTNAYGAAPQNFIADIAEVYLPAPTDSSP